MDRSKEGRTDKFEQALALLEELDESLVVTQIHHRRPRSLDGTSYLYNISHVPPELHRNWHIMFGNMNALQISHTINSFRWVEKNGLYVKCRLINGDVCEKLGRHNSTNEQKCRQAWDIMFKGLDFSQAVKSMNSTWIDPSYHFSVTKRRPK